MGKQIRIGTEIKLLKLWVGMKLEMEEGGGHGGLNEDGGLGWLQGLERDGNETVCEMG